MKKSISRKIPVLDISGPSAFQKYHGNDPDLQAEGSRIVAFFDADNIFFDLSARYNHNEPVNVLDFCNFQRQLKARILAMKGGQK